MNQQATEAGTAPTGGVGSINPQLYAIGAGSNYGSDLHDVSVGNNDTDGQPVWFSAVTGYDLVTGWGSANGQNLIDALAGPQVPGFWLASSLSNVSIAQGSSSSTTITVTDAGGFSDNVTLAVTSTLPTGVIASWGTNPTAGTSVFDPDRKQFRLGRDGYGDHHGNFRQYDRIHQHYGQRPCAKLHALGFAGHTHDQPGRVRYDEGYGDSSVRV